MPTIREMYGIPSEFSSKDGFNASVECEIECIGDFMGMVNTKYNVIEDGSLRNSGREFVSKGPLPRENILSNFRMLHKAIQFKANGHEPFSERTSIHVHVNVLDQTSDQVKNLVMLYALFEPLLFKMVHPDRANNIFCVALNQTILPEVYRSNLETLRRHWSKYTALNLLRLNDLGTVEFRHMHGHNDEDTLNRWLTVIENLWVASQEVAVNRTFLQSKDEIWNLYRQIFSEFAYCDTPEQLFSIISNSLTDVKLSLN